MVSTTQRFPSLAIVLFLLIGIFVGLSFLQVRLSKKQNESYGLILPTVFFVLSVLLVLLSGVIDNETPSFSQYIGGILLYFVLYNLPTAAYLIIYTVCRKNGKAKKEMEKMNIMDLE